MQDKSREPGSIDRPGAAPQSTLSRELDRLLQEVEALTEEVLADTSPNPAAASAPTAQTPPPPAAQPAIDDRGIASETPLVHQVESVPLEDLVADVDRELDHMEQLLQSTGEADDRAPPLAEEFPDIPEVPEKPSVAQLAVDLEAASKAAASLESPAQSTKEQKLDDDLDALLAGQAPLAAARPPPVAVPRPAPAADLPPASTQLEQKPTPAPGRTPAIDPTMLEGISIGRLMVERLKRNARRTLAALTGRSLNALLKLLNGFDALIGHRLSPRARELAGFCALGTLAMCVVALVVALL